MSTKYIVNNLPNQTIDGNITLTDVSFTSGVTGATGTSISSTNITIEQDEDFSINVSYFAMTSPPGILESNFVFQADGVMKVPGTITSDADLNLINNGTGDIRLGYQYTPVDVYIGTSGDGKRLDLNSDRIRILSNPPASSVGSDGDFIGGVAFDSTYIYYCTGNYDGVSNIWRRLQFSGDTW